MTPREAALAIWRSALAAGDVAAIFRTVLHRRGDCLIVGGDTIDLSRVRRVLVLGFGKAGAPMARAVEEALGDRIGEGFVVVKDGHTLPTRRVQLAEAGHPVPDARGVAAAARLVELAESAGPEDLVLVLISGGGSALTPAPASPVTLEEKQAVTRLLLGAGATINELNAVRKHLSRLKGGQLARAAAPARVVALALSDVIGDPLDVIASGPTAPDPTTFADALQVLAARGVRDRAPRAVVDRLLAGTRGELPETPKPGDRLFERVTTRVIGNNALVTDAARAEAERLGYATTLATRSLEGEARVMARAFVREGREMVAPACLLAGGETTVTVRGGGRGGRCQEFALAAALALDADEDVAVLAAGTDGTDGPTDAAGAVVDVCTVDRARVAGLDPVAALEDNDAYRVLAATGDLVITGPTNTNLLDVYVLVRGACPSAGRSDANG